MCKPSGLVGPVSSLAVLDVAGVGLQLGDELSFYKRLAGKHPELNVKLGTGVVFSSRVTNTLLLKQCHASLAAMEQPPYNAFLIVNTRNVQVLRVDFETPLPAIVTATIWSVSSITAVPTQCSEGITSTTLAAPAAV